jgi:DNA invertase Pin-like site-specific DNA recombinase
MDAVIYAAKSTEDKRGSIDTQLADCRELAQRERWRVAGEFSDENRSAYHGSRGEGLQRAKAQAEELAPCVLVVQHSDRLARGDAVQATHLVAIALWAIKAGITIRSVQDERTFQDLATAANQGERNTEDSRRKGEATKDGIERAVKRGRPLA